MYKRQIINGIDVRRYGATLLTAETKPPNMTANYEMMSKALLPTEYDTDIPLGSMTMTIYFRGKNRATLERTMSSFMQNFRSSCIMAVSYTHLDVYKRQDESNLLTEHTEAAAAIKDWFSKVQEKPDAA